MNQKYKQMLKGMVKKEKSKQLKRKLREKPWFLYILECDDGTFYTGVTTDLERRFKMHNAGKASRYTRTHLPVRMLYHESLKNRTQALVRECAIKAFTRKRKLALIYSNLSQNKGPSQKTKLKMKKIISIFLLFYIFTNAPLFCEEKGSTMENKSVYSFTMKTIDGHEKRLAVYKGKTILIVNTASKCGFTPQYKSMEALYEKYKGKGFEILAFPANNFMGQEPGSNEEIKKFCELKYKTSFPLFSKISVKGGDIHPLYQYLTTESGFNGDIAWNFNKFLVAPDGRVVARFGSKDDPLSEKITGEIDKIVPLK